MDTKTLARKVRIRRTDLGLKQRALSDLFELTHTAASMWERGVNRIPHECFPQLAKLLQTNIKFFYEEDYWPKGDKEEEEDPSGALFSRSELEGMTPEDLQWGKRMIRLLKSVSPEERERFRKHLEKDADSIKELLTKSG